mgnify:CR=1 FL=1
MAKVDVEMPKMGESITEGMIIEWHKQPGDEVEQDETILEIGTDKVDTEVPSPAAGVLAETLVAEGETVDVGTIIARIETDAEAPIDSEPDAAPPAEAADETADETGNEPAAANAAPEPAADPSADASEPADESVEVTMPKMGESITEGMIIAWHKDVGDAIGIDETILEIGTDKVDTEVPSPAAGVLQEKLVDEGETVEVGTVIARIGAEALPGAAAEPTTPEPEPTPEPAPVAEPSGDGTAHDPQPAPAGGDEIPRHDEDGSFYSPLVRSIAQEEGLSLAELQSIDGSGRDGRVTKEDVMDYLETREAPSEAPTEVPTPSAPSPATPPPRPAAPATGTAYTVEEGPSNEELAQRYGDRIEIMEMDRMRKITAEHMIRSRATSAHVTSFAEADVTGLVRFREKTKAQFMEREGVKLTFTPFFVKAAVEALREHPIVNSSVEGDKIVLKKDIHIGVAVAIGQKGLLAPVIRNAGDLNLVGLARKTANMAERARNKELQPNELQGGTFTVTNIGSLGSLMGTPIINQPQVGILATGAIKKRPVVIEDPDLGDVISVRHMMYLSMSYDHRIIDGAMGSSFLKRVVDELESISEEDRLF